MSFWTHYAIKPDTALGDASCDACDAEFLSTHSSAGLAIEDPGADRESYRARYEQTRLVFLADRITLS